MGDQADPDGHRRVAREHPFIHVAAGAAMGALVGSLIGLSTVPVVSVVVSALTAVIGAFLGLAGGAIGKFTLSSSWRVLGFGVFCVIFIVGGIQIRTHQVLERSLKDQIEEISQFTFITDDVKRLVILRQYGISPVTPGSDALKVDPLPNQLVGALFSVTPDQCNVLKRTRGNADVNRLANLKGMTALAKEMAGHIEQAPSDRQKSLLDAAEILLCGES